MLILYQLKLEYSTGQFWDPNAKPVSEQVLWHGGDVSAHPIYFDLNLP
jgi:hypothetical protein